MAHTGRTFRVFISSTFSDLVQERDVLQRDVFPRLRELCRRQGARFQAVDLRWGINEEASYDQRTMDICLTEIERCRQVSPRPNFLVLLGDRYGTQLLPARIPLSELEAIGRQLTQEQRDQLYTWYRLDENASAPEYCLLPRTDAYINPAIWQPVAEQLRELLLEGLGALPPGAYDPLPYLASATEQEIHAGVFTPPDAPAHVHCFFRTIADLPDDADAASYRDLTPDGKPDSEREAQRDDLKRRLREHLPADHIHDYTARWENGTMSTDHLSRLCEDIYSALASSIQAELDIVRQIDPIEQEIADQFAFGEEQRKYFIGRTDAMQAILHYTDSDDAMHPPLMVVGAAGLGKTTLMAEAAEQARQRYPDAVVLVIYIGATPGAGDTRTLLQTLCRQIPRSYNADEMASSLDLNDLPTEFSTQLKRASAQRPLILFVDALDQLRHGASLLDLDWVPSVLPQNTRMIVSALVNDDIVPLQQRLPESSIYELKGMSPDEGRTLLEHWLAQAQRTLQPFQLTEALNAFAAEGLPLYLKLAFEEARLWKSYASAETLPTTIPDMMERLFTWLARPANHGSVLVEHALGALGAAKEGLSEDELLDILSDDDEMMADFQQRSPRANEAHDGLPIVIWSRLYFDLKPYLTDRMVEDSMLMGFYHQQFAASVADEFLTGEKKLARHRALANYFKKPPRSHSSADHFSPDDESVDVDGQPLYTPRGLVELPYQLTEGQSWNDVFALFTNFAFLEQKAALGPVEMPMLIGTPRHMYSGGYQLQEDIDTAWRKLEQYIAEQERAQHKTTPGVAIYRQKVESLQAIYAALTRQSQRLSTHPELMWQLLYNELQWAGEDLQQALAPELDRHRAAGIAPWLHLTLPPHEAPALLLRLHQSYGRELDFMTIKSCAFSPDDVWITSSMGGTISVWQAHTGELVAEFATPEQYCGFIRDSSTNAIRLVTIGFISNEVNAVIWDIKTRREQGRLQQLISQESIVRDATMSFDGHLIVAAVDGKLAVLDIRLGDGKMCESQEVGIIRSCAFSSDNLRLATGDDFGVAVWDTTTWQVIRRCQEPYLPQGVSVCAFIPGTHHVVTAHGNAELKIWDTDNGEQLSKMTHIFNYNKFQTGIMACAVSPNGQYIASGGVDHTIKLWSVATGELLSTFAGHARPIRSCVFNWDSTRLASGDDGGDVLIWDITAQRSDRDIASEHSGDITDCAISRDGTYFITTSADKTVRVWEITTGRLRHALNGHRSEINSCAISADSSFIISGAENEVVRIWDASTGESLAKERPAGRIGRGNNVACAISPDDSFVVVGIGYELFLMTTTSFFASPPLRGHTDAIIACAVSPDANWIVSGSEDGTISVWKTAEARDLMALSHQPYHTLQGHDTTVRYCVFSPNGAFLATAASESRQWGERARTESPILIWDTATWTEALAIPGPREHITGLAWTPDGKSLICADHNGDITVFDASHGNALARFSTALRITCFALHPWMPFAVAGSRGGDKLAIRLEGIEYGPLVVTATRHEDAFLVRCPMCGATHTIPETQLGRMYDCPTPGCGSQLRLNSFVLTPAPTRRRTSQANDEERVLDIPTAPARARKGCWPLGRHKRLK